MEKLISLQSNFKTFFSKLAKHNHILMDMEFQNSRLKVSDMFFCMEWAICSNSREKWTNQNWPFGPKSQNKLIRDNLIYNPAKLSGSEWSGLSRRGGLFLSSELFEGLKGITPFWSVLLKTCAAIIANGKWLSYCGCTGLIATFTPHKSSTPKLGILSTISD